MTGHVRTGAVTVTGTPIFDSFPVHVDDCSGANNLTVSIPDAAVDVWLPFTAAFTDSSNSATITFVGEVVTDSDYLIDDVLIVDAASVSYIGSTTNAPAPILQQFGKPLNSACEEVAPPMLNWGGAEGGGWSESWAQWIDDGKGGSVCTRTIFFNSSLSRWMVG